jgi:hypothetical protein
MSNAAREAQRREAANAQEDILRAYRQRTPRSAALYARASKALSGASATFRRTFG